MSDFNLIDIVNLIRAEIRKTQVGPLKKVIGPTGAQGPMGETGPQGPAGPRGNDGMPGPQGAKGNQGKKGDKGVKGDDGADGVGIARVEQDIDDAIVVYLTDGNSYTIEMPLINDDGSLAKEVHYKSGGGGGSGIVDLSGYVRRPSDTHGGKWLLYREPDGTNQGEWAPATTDLIETNGQLMFRDSLGRFQPTPEELDELDNQLKVNRFIWEKIQELDLKAGGVAISDTAPIEPENGMFWFDNSEDVMQLFIWHTDSDAWIPVAPPTTLEGRVDAGEATQQAIIAQIQESLVEQETIKNKINALEGVVGEHSLAFTTINSNPRHGEFNLKDSGMQMTNMISSAQYISMTDTDGAGNTIDLDRITEGDVLRFSSVDGQAAELKITDGTNGVFTFNKVSGDLDRLSEMPYQFILLSSFDPAGLATIDYVDDQDAMLSTMITNNGKALNNKADKTDLESLQEEIDYMKTKPPGRPFRFSSVDSLGSGGFWYSDAGGQKRMRLNKTDADGFVWMYDSPEQDANTSDHYSTAYTIRYWDGSAKTWRIRFTGFITRIDWHANDVLFYIPLHYSKEGMSKLGNNTKYYITVGGII